MACEIWSDEEGDLRRKLRQALWQAQSCLARVDEHLKGLVRHRGNEWLEIDSRFEVVVDALQLEDAAEALQGSDFEEFGDDALRQLEDTIDAVQGGFLEGCFSDWCVFERERLNDLYVNLLEHLMKVCEGRSWFAKGIRYGSLVLREDRARERTHRRMMRLFYLAGDRTGALRQYGRCAQSLEEELGVAPSRRTLALEEVIRLELPLGELETRVSAGGPDAEALLGRLLELQEVLRETRGGLRAEISQLRKILQRA